MNCTITTTLAEPLYKFLLSQAEEKKVSRKKILEEALNELQKKELLKQIEEACKDEELMNENRKICNEFREVQLLSIDDY